MDNCKVCGKPVRSTPVIHGNCMTRVVREVSNEICDNYCCHSKEDMTPEMLEGICGNCPLNRLAQLCE